jgi:hypothetical protein
MPAVTLNANTFLSLSGAGVNSGTNSLFYHTCSGEDRFLVVNIVTTSAGAPTDPSYVYYNNAAMTFANTVINGGVYLRTYYMVNPPTGNNTVIVRWAASTTRGGIIATSFANVSQLVTPPFTFRTSTSNSVSIASRTGFIVFDAIGTGSGDSTTYTADANQTQLSNFIGSAGAGGNSARIASSIEDGNSSSNSIMSWTVGGGGGQTTHIALSIASTDVSIIDVDTDETVYAGQPGVILSGYNLSGQTAVQIVYQTRSINVAPTTTNASAIVFDVPYSEQLFASNVGFGNVTFNVATASISGTLTTNTFYNIHTVTDISQAANTYSLYYGLSPAVSVGDKFYLPTKTNLGNDLYVDSQGFIEINSPNDTTDSFDYRIYSDLYYVWGEAGTFTASGLTKISNKIKMYIRVVRDFFESFETYSTITDAINGPWDSQDTSNGGTHSISLFQGSNRYTSTWTQNESRTLLYYRFPGAINGDVSTGKTYIRLQWDEYRDANWDFQADKSCRIVGRLSNGNVTLDVLLGLEGSGTPGNSTRAIVFGQGLGTSSNFVIDNDWNMNREQWYTIAVEIQLNSIGNSDGWIKLWRDGELMGSASNINIRGSSNDYTFHQFAIGGWESGGAPVSSETRYIDNVEVIYR